MKFSVGDVVEICCAEDGFWGSYYAATILKKKPENKYLVEYKTLVTEKDETVYLKEIVDGKKVRPIPPGINYKVKMFTDFKTNQMVDVQDNDGWWEGRIVRKSGSGYFIHFETTGETVDYPAYRLRPHYEFFCGKWFSVV